MKNAIWTYLFQIGMWTFGFNLLGIPVYFMLLDMQACMDPSMPFNFWFGILTSVMTGILVGMILGTIDLILERYVRKRQSFRRWFLTKTGLYISVFLVMVISVGISVRFASTGNLESSVEETLTKSGMNVMLAYLSFSLLYSIIVSFIGQVGKIVGPDMLWPMFAGKYFSPKQEDRIFMFLDIKSSTTAAEQMGHLKYSKFLQDFFYELNQCASKYKASIYKYVGDEAILSWLVKDKDSNLNSVKFFCALKKLLRKKHSYFKFQYGWQPEFSAGINSGVTTVSEIGEFKKEIAYHGDVLNTAARLQSSCSSYNEALLISDSTKMLLPATNAFQIVLRDKTVLRGKHAQVEIFAVRQPG